MLVNLSRSSSDTRTTWSTSATCRRQIGHSVNFLPHWLQATRWPQSRMTKSMSASKRNFLFGPVLLLLGSFSVLSIAFLFF